VIGAAVADTEMQRILERLGMDVRTGAEAWSVTPPAWRFDVAIERT